LLPQSSSLQITGGWGRGASKPRKGGKSIFRNWKRRNHAGRGETILYRGRREEGELLKNVKRGKVREEERVLHHNNGSLFKKKIRFN